MRRAISTFLILIQWLGPFAALLPAQAESRLPACCRRHGNHHCSMNLNEASAVDAVTGLTLALTAPAHCPLFPQGAAAIGATQALAARSILSPAFYSSPRPLVSHFVAPLDPRLRATSSRAPPASSSLV
jgi:hypothetical protein